MIKQGRSDKPFPTRIPQLQIFRAIHNRLRAFEAPEELEARLLSN